MKRSMFELSAYVIVSLSAGGGAGGGRTDRKTESVRRGDSEGESRK